MNGLKFLDLVIGLIFIYLIYSISASAIWEIFVNITQLRGKMLRNWITKNFVLLRTPDDPQSNQILEHPLIKGASGKANGRPSYISSNVFSEVLVDLIFKADKSINDLSKIKLELNTFRQSLASTNLLPEGLKGVFLQYTDEASATLQNVKDKMGKWYDEAQERLLGSYKKNLQKWILVISAVLVGGTNADTIKIASYLYDNNDAREAIATKASFFVQDSSIISFNNKIKAYSQKPDSAIKKSDEEIIKTLDNNVKVIQSLNSELKKTGIPLGWGREVVKNYELKDFILKILGLLLTILSVSMGSPFWFDILSKLSNLRAAGSKPKSQLDVDTDKKDDKNSQN